MIRAEINNIEFLKMAEEINESKSWSGFFLKD